jgi:predicted amidohydrolase YtcJ
MASSTWPSRPATTSSLSLWNNDAIPARLSRISRRRAAVRADTTTPGLILHNAGIHTVDASQPRAEAVAIASGRFLAVGSNRDVLALATARTRKIDLGGKTVVPGFIDAHTHVASSGLRPLRQLDCDLRSIAAIQEAIRKRAGSTPKGNWIVGFKYDDTKTSEGRKLTRADLDAAAPEHPVFVEHRGGHTAFVNSVAMRIAGVDDKTPDPAGGRFDRDTAGRLTGRLKETAIQRFESKIPSTYTRDDYREGVKLIGAMFARASVTSVHDAQGSPEDLAAYQDARQGGELKVRICHLLNYRHLDRMLAAGVRAGLGDDWIRAGVLKLVSDGSISERTARLSKPYEGRRMISAFR